MKAYHDEIAGKQMHRVLLEKSHLWLVVTIHAVAVLLEACPVQVVTLPTMA